MNAKLKLELKGLIRQYGVNSIVEELSNLCLELAHYSAEEGYFNAEKQLQLQSAKLNNCKNEIVADRIVKLEREGLNYG